MNIIIYNTNSFGGNHEYSRALAGAYAAAHDVTKVTLVMPANSPAANDADVAPILLPDISTSRFSLVRKLYFVRRSIANPFRLLKWLKTQPVSTLIFNDYDQLTSLLWVPFFRPLRRSFIFAIILHDPDRDAYLFSPRLAIASMTKLMSLMDVAFYHGFLPDKAYYRNAVLKIIVPHGVYAPVEPDKALAAMIAARRTRPVLLGLLGNIREEKNYDLIIRSLTALTDCDLLIAGSSANSSVPVESYHQLVTNLGLKGRVIWIEKFLTISEFNAAIDACDIVLLYYKGSFTSQSGILNSIAPYKKKLVVADVPSALRDITNQFHLGAIINAENSEAFVDGVQQVQLEDSVQVQARWETYLNSASWDNHVSIAMETFQKLRSA